MTFGLSAGIYPIETNKSVYVPSVSTSAAAIVVQSLKGPANTPTLITSTKQFTDTFGSPNSNFLSMYSALNYLQAGNVLWVVRLINGSVAASVAVADTSTGTSFTVSASSPGTWGNNINITFASNPLVANTFKLIVTVGGVVVETWVVSKLVNLLDGKGKSLYIQNVINGNSAYITVADNTSDALGPLLTQNLNTTGGIDDSGSVQDSTVNTAYNFFLNKDLYDITLLINGGWDTVAVQTNLVTIASTRLDCIALLDMPFAQTTPAAMQTYVTTTLNQNSTYAAIYAGWPQIYDGFNDANIYVPPSGFAAQVIAYSQTVGQPWSAPAGLQRGVIQAVGISYIFQSGDRDLLYQSGINPIQSFVGQGISIQGQKTLTSIPSAVDRINVRLLLITIEKAITKALRPFVFEANNGFTQDNITSIVTNYMNVVKAKQGVYDFLCVCNASNNPPATVAQNKLFVDLYVKPTITAEFIQLNTIVTATGISFTSGQL